MFSRAALIGGVSLALLLGGCSLGRASSSGSTSGFTGTKALVASTINLLASDAASSSNGTDICTHVLSTQLRSRLNRLGTCSTIIDHQLKTVDDTALTIRSIAVNGSTATALVQTKFNGTKVNSTLSLRNETSGWRIAALSGG